MGTLNAALDWARRGFRVFPLLENDKEPAYADDWRQIATNDPDMITRMWRDPVLGTERNYNIGCSCNDMVVVDIDVKKDKDGYNQYMMMGGHFDTLSVRTPSGGFHCYFYGPDSSNEPLSSGVDVRSHNGYTVAPGSSIDGVFYAVINDVDKAWIPDPIERLLKAPYARTEVEYDEDIIDTPASIAAAINFLQSCPPAIQGQRGDETTFTTAARVVREMALSIRMAHSLMVEHFNPRCEPMWTSDELLEKIENAARYGTADMGVLSPEQMFAGISIPDMPPTVFAQYALDFGNATMPDAMPARNWLVERMLMRGSVSLLLATGSAGKSSVSLALAMHLAVGLPFAGYPAPKAPTKCIVYNGEDDIHEQSRRMLGIAMQYGISYELAKANIMLLSPQQIKFDLVAREFSKPIRNDVLVNQIIDRCSAEDVGLLILDPLVKIHKVEESDNVQMDFVMETLTEIAQKSNIAVLALHHTSKGSGNQDGRIGNMDIARGASAVVNAARIVFTLLNATREDAIEYGLSDEERSIWVRMDDAKMNLALANNTATWFQKQSQPMPFSPDTVGVLRYRESMRKNPNYMRERFTQILGDALTSMGSGSLTMKQILPIIRTQEPLMRNKVDKDIRIMVEGYFSEGSKYGNYDLISVREDGKDFLLKFK